MKNDRQRISLKAIMEAEKALARAMLNPQAAKLDFVILHPKTVSLYKTKTGFEPLTAYIDEVQPYDGEVGRYDTGGPKVRIIQQERLR